MLLVTFAVPHESRFFRRTAAASQVRVLHTGIGEGAARQALRKAIEHERPSAVISSGFAGGLDPALKVGDLVADSAVSAPDLLSELPTTIRRGRIHTTSDPAASPDAKTRLHRETGADAVDMETAAIAAECALACIPLLVVRAISDAASDSIPIPLEIAWDLQRQAPRPVQLVLYLARHPRRMGPFFTFLRYTNTAASRLGAVLSEITLTNAPQRCK